MIAYLRNQQIQDSVAGGGGSGGNLLAGFTVRNQGKVFMELEWGGGGGLTYMEQ
jgi:hypothetical protein